MYPQRREIVNVFSDSGTITAANTYEVRPLVRGTVLTADFSEGDVVSVDADTGTITDETTGAVFQAQPFPPFIQEIINDGGLVARTKRVMAQKGGN